MRQLAILLLSLAVPITAGCGWHLRNMTMVPIQINKIIFDSDDPNGPLSRAIRHQWYFKNVQLIEKSSLHQDFPSFCILDSSLNKDTISIFQDGHTAEYQIVLSVSAAVLISDKEIYPISTNVYRSFFANPQAALAKDSEQQIIINEMYDRAAEYLLQQLAKAFMAHREMAA